MTKQPRIVIVMGVSGSGKTTVAQGIAQEFGWTYIEGDDLHPQANVSKMASGHPLTDEDRWPWLERIGEVIDTHIRDGRSAVITCSALKRIYRDVLRAGRDQVTFCHVDVPRAELERRVATRQGHYMPASLLDSQLATLEPLQSDEPGVVVPAVGEPSVVAAAVKEALGLSSPPTA